MADESRILTQDAQPIVDGDDNHIPIAGQDAAVKHIPSSFHVRAPMDENHHRLGASALPNIWRRGEEEEKVVEKAEGLIRRQTEGDSQKCNFNTEEGFIYLCAWRTDFCLASRPRQSWASNH